MEKAISEFGCGLKYFFKAIGFMSKNGLLYFLLFPLLITIAIFIIGFSSVGTISDSIINYFGLNNSEFLGKWLVLFSVGIIIKIITFIILGYIGGFLTLIILSPILSILSEKTEKIINGNEYAFDAEQMIRDMLRGIYIAICNMFKEFLCIIAVFVLTIFLGWIPLIGQLLALAGQAFLFLLAAYYYGFSFMDYTNERRRLKAKQSINAIRNQKGLAIGNGIIYSLSMMIPFFGSFVASFVAVISVIGSTMSMIENDDNSKKLPQA